MVCVIGDKVRTPYGEGVVQGFREGDGIYEVELTSWKLAQDAPVYVYVTDRDLTLVSFAVGQSVSSVYGTGVVEAFREDGMHQVRLTSWTLAEKAPVYVYARSSQLSPAVEENLAPGALKKITKRRGVGPLPEFKQEVTLALEVRLQGTDTIVDTRLLTIRIGDRETLPGVELAAKFLRLGELCVLECEHRYAYGPVGRKKCKFGPEIPPSSNLSILIEMRDVGLIKNNTFMSAAERVAEGTRKKHRGNDFYEEGQVEKALDCYRNAIRVVEAASEGPEGKELLQLNLVCGNNMATCYQQLGRTKDCKDALVRILQLDGSNVKALLRAADLSIQDSEFEEASACLKKLRGLNLEDAQKTLFRKREAQLNRAKAEYNLKQKKAFSGFLDKHKDVLSEPPKQEEKDDKQAEDKKKKGSDEVNEKKSKKKSKGKSKGKSKENQPPSQPPSRKFPWLWLAGISTATVLTAAFAYKFYGARGHRSK